MQRKSSTPSARPIPSVDCGSVGTGIDRSPRPRSPSIDEADLPGAGRHHPEMGGEQLRIVRRAGGDVWNRRKPGAWSGERQRHDAYVAHVGRGGPDFDIGDARNDLRRTDGDEHAIRTGLTVEEDIGAADMGGHARSERDRDEHAGERRPAGRDHRLTRLHGATGPQAQPCHEAGHDGGDEHAAPELHVALSEDESARTATSAACCNPR